MSVQKLYSRTSVGLKTKQNLLESKEDMLLTSSHACSREVLVFTAVELESFTNVHLASSVLEKTDQNSNVVSSWWQRRRTERREAFRSRRQ